MPDYAPGSSAAPANPAYAMGVSEIFITANGFRRFFLLRQRLLAAAFRFLPPARGLADHAHGQAPSAPGSAQRCHAGNCSMRANQASRFGYVSTGSAALARYISGAATA